MEFIVTIKGRLNAKLANHNQVGLTDLIIKAKVANHDRTDQIDLNGAECKCS